MAESNGACVWLTGPSGSGKTTIATAVVEELRRRGVPVVLLDEPDVQAHLSADDRVSALRWLVELLVATEVVVVVAADVPRRAARDRLRAEVAGFVEVFVDGGPGDDAYQEPVAPELRVPTRDRSPEASVALVVSWLERNVLDVPA